MTYYVLCFIRLGIREVYVAGITPHLDQRWMVQKERPRQGKGNVALRPHQTKG